MNFSSWSSAKWASSKWKSSTFKNPNQKKSSDSCCGESFSIKPSEAPNKHRRPAMSLQEELLDAAHEGDCHRLEMLLSGGSGVDVNLAGEEDKSKYPPLHCAALRGHEAAVRLLIARGADVNKQGDFQQTALHLACYNGDPYTVQALLDAGADTEIKNQAGWTPMFWTCTKRRPEALVKLLLAGADINAATPEGWTPLHKACEHGLTCICRSLLRAGADDAAKTMHGDCPLDVGLSRGHGELAAIFEYVRRFRKAREEEEEAAEVVSGARHVLSLKLHSAARRVAGTARKVFEDREDLKCHMKVPCKPEMQRALRDAADVVAERHRRAQRALARAHSSSESTLLARTHSAVLGRTPKRRLAPPAEEHALSHSVSSSASGSESSSGSNTLSRRRAAAVLQ